MIDNLCKVFFFLAEALINFSFELIKNRKYIILEMEGHYLDEIFLTVDLCGLVEFVFLSKQKSGGEYVRSKGPFVCQKA